MTAERGTEEPMDRLDLLALEMRAGFAELRADQAELRSELAEFRTAANDRFSTLIDAVADLRTEYRGHTHDG